MSVKLACETSVDPRRPLTVRRFRSIKAWQHADDLVVEVYRLTQTFPRAEQYGLISQMRRAAVSVAANIVEGSSRRSHQEYLQFLSIAKASLSELSYYIRLAGRLRYLPAPEVQRLEDAGDETARTLYGLMQSVAKETGEGIAA